MMIQSMQVRVTAGQKTPIKLKTMNLPKGEAHCLKDSQA